MARLFPDLAPDERPRFRLVAAGFVCIASATLVARAAGDTLFLSRHGAELLPYMYIGSALLMILVSLLHTRAARRAAPVTLTLATTSLLAGAALLIFVLLRRPGSPVALAAYFLGDLTVQLGMLVFWGYAALVFNPREGKRLFGMIGAAGTAACIVTGRAVKPFAARFGTEGLFPLLALLLGGFAVSVALLARREPARFQIARAQPSAAQPSAARVGYWAGLLRQPQIRSLAVLAVLMTLALVVVDFQFKGAAQERYQEAELAGFLGSFYSGANVVCLVVQLFVVHRVLQAGGILLSLAILPLGLLIGQGGVALTGGAFAWIVASRLMDPVFNFTVNSAALQMLYLGIRKQTRAQARAFVEGTARPLAMAAAGTALVLLAKGMPPARLALAVLALALAWLFFAWRNHKAYVSGLIDAVGARRFELGSDDIALRGGALAAHVKAALLAAPDEDLPYLIGVLPQVGPLDATSELLELLDRPSPAVKVACLEHFRLHPAAGALPAILEHCDHVHAEVRVAAIHAAGRNGAADVLDKLEAHLADPSPGVRAAAAAELINAADLDGLIAAGVVLRQMLTSSEAGWRLAATAALSDIREAELTRLLAVLLEDPDASVLRVALQAAATHPSLRLLPMILPHLGDPRIAGVAADALAALGEPALDPLGRFFDPEARGERAFAMQQLPGAIARIGHPRGLALLERAMLASDAVMRVPAIEGYCQLLRRQPSLTPYLPALDAAVLREIDSAAAVQASLNRLRGMPGSELLEHVLSDERVMHLKCVFGLLDTRIPEVDMNRIFFGLMRGTGEGRAEALELLDNVLEAEPKRRLLSLLEARPGPAPPRAQAVAELVALLAREVSEWVRVGALHAAAESGASELGPAARAALASDSPVVRETALHALTRLDPPAGIATAVRMGDDSDPRVARLARSLAPAP